MPNEPGAPIEPTATPAAAVPSAADPNPPADPSADAGAGNGGTPGGDPAVKGEDKWDAETKAYIQRLRGENAKHRTTNKELRQQIGKIEGAVIGDQPDDPETALVEAVSMNEQLMARNAVLESAIENKIPHDQVDYYGYLIGKEAEELEEGDELDLTPIVDRVMKIGQSEPMPGAGATTGTPPPKGGAPGAGGNQPGVEQFKKMTFLEKSTLQRENPELYESLKSQSLG